MKPGDIIYLNKKHRRADKEHIVNVVREGESMYYISQKYGIRLKNLYKMNKMKQMCIRDRRYKDFFFFIECHITMHHGTDTDCCQGFYFCVI